MRIRNKKTGEIRELPDGFFCGDNLKKICEEWEDAPEEPKEFWFVNDIGEVEVIKEDDSEETEDAKQIGNYFETKEEAELAVEKLKAFKRLKDKGLRFEGWGMGGEYGNTITFSDYIEYDDETRADLDLLFCSEVKNE